MCEKKDLFRVNLKFAEQYIEKEHLQCECCVHATVSLMEEPCCNCIHNDVFEDTTDG